MQGDLEEADRYLLQSLTIKATLAPGSLSYAITSMNAGNVAHRPPYGGRLAGFYDANMANRIARALSYAVELCDGGSQPEPF